jgi:hypothetical protein
VGRGITTSPTNRLPISFTIKVVAFLEKKLEGLKVTKLEGSKVERVKDMDLTPALSC